MKLGAPGWNFGDPVDGALAAPDIIVTGDEPFALRGVARLRIVDRHSIG
jgi:hypothetical protein